MPSGEIAMTFFFRLLSSSGMSTAYSAMAGQFQYYIHVARRSAFQGIFKDGLRPHEKEAATDVSMQDMSAVIDRRIICFSPYPRKAPLVIEAFILAVPHQGFAKIGVDWSHGGCSAYCSRYDSVSDQNLGEAFVGLVRSMESFVTYQKVLSSALRVCPKSNPDAPPSAWPELLLDVARGSPPPSAGFGWERNCHATPSEALTIRSII
jgi:hypothetical protein